MDLDDVTGPERQPSAAVPPSPAESASPPLAPPSDAQVPARIYPEYTNYTAAQVDVETARLKNRMRALAIRVESCDRTLGHALLLSHREVCAEVGGGEILKRVAALEVHRSEAVGKGRRPKGASDGLLGGLLGSRRADVARSREGGTSEGELKVPEPIDRELVELARAVGSDSRISDLPDETVRASLAKRTELALEGADIEGRLRFLRRRIAPATLERPRAAGDFRPTLHGEGPSDPQSEGSPSSGVSSSGDDVPSSILAHLHEFDRRLDQRLSDVTRALDELRRSLETTHLPTPTADPTDREAQQIRHVALQARLGSIEEELARRLAAVDASQRTLTQELTDAFTHHEEAQLRILKREDELRAGRLELAAAQLAADTMRKHAAEAELEVTRASHSARLEEEEMRMRVDSARHAQTMREQQDAQERAIERAAEEARLQAAEQARTREARTSELERMARLRSRAESAATARRIREARERRRNTLIWVSALSGLVVLILGLLWASGLLGAATQYLRNGAAPTARVVPLESPTKPEGKPPSAPTRKSAPNP